MEYTPIALKGEISDILSRYNIPEDDRSLVLERIEGEFEAMVQAMTQKVMEEHASAMAKMGGTQGDARKSVEGVVSQAKASVKKAYKLGYQEGLAQTSPSKPSWVQIGFLVGILALATVVVVREFLPRKD